MGRTYSDTLPERYKISISSIRKTILASIPTMYKTEDHIRMTYKFADQQAFLSSYLLSGGDVYSDWIELENYVNDILHKIMPDELKHDSSIHVYLYKDGAFDVYMTYGGHIFLDIGIFGSIYDEASLAALLTHELAHYYKKHSFQIFFNSLTKWDHVPVKYEKVKRNFLINHEIEADSLAIVWMNRTDYNTSGTLKVFQVFNRLEQKEIMRNKYVLKKEYQEHPVSEKRLERMNDFLNNSKNANGENFLIDKEKFFRFQEEAKPEILKSLMNNFSYSSCIETAFKFHLFDPDNPTFIYYLMESVRRMCYLNGELWKENFITHRYYEKNKDEEKLEKRKVNESLFEKFNVGIMGMSPQENTRIKARFYWESQPSRFVTYKQAFIFYSKLAKLINCKECILSDALGNSANKLKQDSLLHEYLTYTEIKHKKFAETLLKDPIIKNLEKKNCLR